MNNERGNYDGSSRKKGVVPWSAGNHTVDVRPKNWLTPVALLTLREKSSYGYELMNRIAQFGFEAINAGTMYRALRHMEKEGLCESEWETSNGAGPACRMYSVTDAGEAYIASWAKECEEYQRVLDSFYLAYAERRSSSASEESEAS
jgi:PadR family transcriptional regulator, regulatory protein PadR